MAAGGLKFLVVGGGIVGLATARELQRAYPSSRVRVLEKESRVAAHQSGHNSGVVHAGVYYEPGSLKARFCRAGNARALAYCAERAIPVDRCGKLIVATNPNERDRLDALAERARRNGLDCELLDASGLAAAEPAIAGVAALRVRESAIVDWAEVTRALAADLTANGGEVLLGMTVTRIDERASGVVVSAGGNDFEVDYLVVCAGLQADRLARLAGLAIDFAIVPFRGDFFRLPGSRAGLINHLVYPVPDPRLPFLGIHLTRTIDGGITVGPSAMLALGREAYSPWSVDFGDLAELARFPGLYRLLATYPGAGLRELGYGLSRRRYLRAVQRYCPSLTLDDLGPHPSGVRAQAVSRQGRLVHDFVYRQTARTVHVCNAPSPAATAAFPIAEAIVAELANRVAVPRATVAAAAAV